MSVATLKLTSAELDHALSFIEVTKSSDFFPEPFEVAALRHCWDKVRPILEGLELLSYAPRQAYEMVAPKQRCLVRPVCLLDPIDLLIYTALTIRLAPAIQLKRDEYQRDRVFSTRFSERRYGQRDMFASNWVMYVMQTMTLCKKYSYIGTADIVDFFPRIYLHRLENALNAASADGHAVKAMMRMLDAWAHGTSYGIPTGPRASNFLAEALLTEVDEYLISFGVEFLRWTDDYLVFGNSEEEVVSALHRLGERLNQTEGLSLNSAKTRVRTTEEYVQHALRFDDTTHALRTTIHDILTHVTGPYDEIDYDELTDVQKAAIDKVDAKRMLSEALEGDLVDLRAVKFVLRFLSAFRRPDLVEPVLENLPKLLPVADSVAKFFDVLDEVEEAAHADIGARLLKYITGAQFVPDFQAMWLLDPFTKSSNWNNLPELRQIASESKNRFIRRQATLGLYRSGSRSALLDAKSRLDDSRDWEERAILFACSRLPRDEYDAIVGHVGGHGGQWTAADLLRKAVLVYAKSLPT